MIYATRVAGVDGTLLQVSVTETTKYGISAVNNVKQRPNGYSTLRRYDGEKFELFT